MKPVVLLIMLSGMGYTFSTCLIMPSFAGSVPVGAASGVNLPTSLETTNISPPPPITVDIPVVVETPVIPTTPGTVTTPVVVETPV
ncbi:hypothetical protein, partial [Cylindrospermopsis raciborskii]